MNMFRDRLKFLFKHTPGGNMRYWFLCPDMEECNNPTLVEIKNADL
jgi:hypothetical protein